MKNNSDEVIIQQKNPNNLANSNFNQNESYIDQSKKNNTKLNENYSKSENEKGLEINLNKINDSNTTKEEESIYITDENIQYCSSPKSGLVSIKKTKNNNNAIINIGSQICNITNTITLNIAMIKKEINGSEIKSDIPRSTTHKKKEKEINDKQNNDNNNNNLNIEIMNSKSFNCKDSQNDRDKRDKIKSFFTKKSKRYKDSNDKINKILTCEDINATNNIKKNSKVKKKKSKVRKSQEKNETKNSNEHNKSSIHFEKEKIIKKMKKKTQKIKNKTDYETLIEKKREKAKRER